MNGDSIWNNIVRVLQEWPEHVPTPSDRIKIAVVVPP